MTDILPIKRALISVSDKTGLLEHAKALSDLGAALVSTGGTHKAIGDAGLKVEDVSAVTGFPEMMDGRVKTLHPKVHGGLLALRDNAEHTKAMQAHGIQSFDVLYVNLYPFEATVARGADFDTCIENIDIGGPAMIRAAAKNYGFIAVATDAEDMEAILAEAKQHGGTTLALRKKLAAKAFSRTGAYDAAISSWYAEQLKETAPTWRAFGGKLKQTLRYGENSHQGAAFYTNGEQRYGVATAKQLQGKELSYNNLNDTDAAFELVAEFDPTQSAAVAIIKHANPCGVALGADLSEAYARALECDPVSAFGGIIAVNRKLDKAAAERMIEIFTEVVIAPAADEDAIAVFAKKKNLRLLVTGGLPAPNQRALTYKTLAGGFLVQDRDIGRVTKDELKIVTKKAPTDAQLRDLLFAFTVCKHVKSNAIVYARDGQTAGIGAGQMNRRDSARIATIRAKEAAEMAKKTGSLADGSACASDAFFPFPDGLLQAVEAGATSVIQPGGSIRDDEVIAAADEAGIAMVFTGMRHFRH
ncbi:MAG TPA: bifunctional phosphoribosylaminoimidazolecarboxamide formyltransferase/IMP cyclohydrolase [Vitreimonas sp.]|uniref:bifunctional phosphoribosylaminoimidazolecarboxamide formyltransferase/IMP cyclohydrolase n=1 Tax=Vitreimonas sp. TaxID=3069702 RepID=UPI002D49B6CA|nr:bifunctional phosphoribosylaminoimidazolecarboxamide formyltransferase/IMP cyclohydrolase [Vitreimonas sp.]HYD86323.1 bifunctional phosphoribosylaminoimidazolecarboxamide formyltransferase/IMP cyclohydrolase [Vitreimonas sp.]